MIEQRVFCDKCNTECSDNYYMVNLYNHTEAGTYTTKTSIDLCPACYSLIGRFLDAEFCVPVNEDFDDYDL